MNLSKSIKLFAFVLIFASIAQAQTGGDFTITQSVVAGGGGQNSAGGTFSVDGTIGQTLAGNAIGSTPFSLTSGFWNFTAMAPTAANVNLGGQVRTANGNGIRNVIVMLTAPNGTIRTIQTGSFGYFKFENIEIGTYVISVSARRYAFDQPIQICSVLEEITDLEFVANDQ